MGARDIEINNRQKARQAKEKQINVKKEKLFKEKQANVNSFQTLSVY